MDDEDPKEVVVILRHAQLRAVMMAVVASRFCYIASNDEPETEVDFETGILMAEEIVDQILKKNRF